MFFQKVVKGINGIGVTDMRRMVNEGILCNWWREAGTISPVLRKEVLTPVNAGLHLNHYHQPVPPANPLARAFPGKTFGQVSPFISTTAGAIQRRAASNFLFDPFLTAIRFATQNFKSDGVVFYAYLLTLGKPAVELEQFSEEVRDLHIYTAYSKYQTQGEIMAKVVIPSVQIEKAEYYQGALAKAAYASGSVPQPTADFSNPSYLKPDTYANIRELLK